MFFLFLVLTIIWQCFGTIVRELLGLSADLFEAYLALQITVLEQKLFKFLTDLLILELATFKCLENPQEICEAWSD